MAAIWPNSVPQNVDPDGYKESPDRNVEEFEPEVGPAKIRRRFSVKTDTIAFQSTMSFVEYEALLAFYRGPLADGTLPFMRRHPRKPTGIFTEFVFVDEPSFAAKGPLHGIVSMTVKRMP